METIKLFEKDLNITIKGTYEKPLFRASDVGAVLEIATIRSVIRDFDSTEKVVRAMHTLGGEQEVTFLTEKGLYQVLFTSRKPIAKKFKNWICEVIEELRLNGKYELEKQIKDIETKLLNSKETTLLETYNNSRGVYLGYIDDNKQIVKFGHGIIGDRIKTHKKEIGENFSLQYIIETIYDRELEQLIKTKLKSRVISKTFPSRKSVCKELIKLEHDYSIENLYNDILKLKKTLKDDLIESQKQIINSLKQKLSKYENMSDDEKEEEEEEELSIFPKVEQDPKPKRKMPLALTEKLKKKVYKFCIEPFNLVSTYNSITEAAEEEKISPVTLTRRINLGTNMGGFIWSFSNEKPKEFFCSKNTIIYKYDAELKLLHKYPSIAEAARLENIETTKLQRLCRTNTLIDGVIYSKLSDLTKFNTPKITNGKMVHKINTSTGEVIEIFKNATEAAIEADVYPSAISRRIKNNTIINGVQYKFVDCY